MARWSTKRTSSPTWLTPRFRTTPTKPSTASSPKGRSTLEGDGVETNGDTDSIGERAADGRAATTICKHAVCGAICHVRSARAPTDRQRERRIVGDHHRDAWIREVPLELRRVVHR